MNYEGGGRQEFLKRRKLDSLVAEMHNEQFLCATVLKMVCIGRCAESTANFLGIAEVG